MPGLVGIIQRESRQNAHRAFETMLIPMRRRDSFKIEMRVGPCESWALGRVHLGVLQPAPQLAEEQKIQVLFHGELHNESEVAKYLETEGVSPRDNTMPSFLDALYQLHGVKFPAFLRGSFCAAILDKERKQLVLVNDRLGSYPLYWFCDSSCFLFASELKALLRNPKIQPTLDPRGVADYLTFGFLLGNKTLAKQTQLLPPASTLTYRWEGGECEVQHYWRAEDLFQPWDGSQQQYHEELIRMFHSAVQRSLGGEHQFGMALSGGLDSRAILSGIDRVRLPILTYTLGAKGCADEVIAQQLSRLAGTKHRFLEIDTAYVGDGLENLRTMVGLTDGMYLTHGLTEMLALQFLEQAGFSVLLRGHGGELAKASLAWPLHTDVRIYGMQSKDEFIPYLLDRVNYISRKISLRELFQDEWFEQVRGQPRLSLEDRVVDVKLSPPDLCSYLYLTEHHRRFTTSSLELFRNMTEVRMPFVDQDFLQVLLRGPAQWRSGVEIHRAIIGAHNPALLKVRNSNTGAAGDAGPLVEKIWDKVNSLLKCLNVYGYRHYHSFERWMKKMLLDTVEGVLLHPKALERGIHRETTLRRLIVETRQGVADHAYLLQILLILELWQQENL
jgi:asparagine synthase (glutamine-hydrolysing)